MLKMFYEVFFALLAVKLLAWAVVVFVGYFNTKFKAWRHFQNSAPPSEWADMTARQRYEHKERRRSFIKWLRENWTY